MLNLGCASSQFDGIDFGEERDPCVRYSVNSEGERVKDPPKQGAYKSQLDTFPSGKIFQIDQALLTLRNIHSEGVPYTQLIKGLRNPYRMDVDEEDNIYIGDVGLVTKDEVSLTIDTPFSVRPDKHCPTRAVQNRGNKFWVAM